MAWLATWGGRRHTVGMSDDPPTLIVADAKAWSRWLADHHQSKGVWLVLAKKGTTDPTSLTYDEALEEALCHGWIDGQLGRGDAATFRRKFGPRNRGSSWSKRNVALADRLIGEGRMCPAGVAAIERAKADGAWNAAYAGQASIEVPGDLHAALVADPSAEQMFNRLSRANRYAVLYRVNTAKRSDTRQRRVEQLVAMLARGETIHPQHGPTQSGDRASAPKMGRTG